MKTRLTSTLLLATVGAAAATVPVQGILVWRPVALQASTPGTTQSGHASISGTLVAGSVKTQGFQMSTGAAAARVLTCDASGNATWQTLPPPSGSAGGDLAGTYPSPSVDGLQGRAVAATAPASGQVLKWNGSAWSPAADSSDLLWQTSGSAAYRMDPVAVGGTSPSATLHAMTSSTSGVAVKGSATAATGSTFGGYFESSSAGGYGVYGRNNETTGTIYGVRGYASTAAGGYAIYAAGDMGASGVKPFCIDHPYDPENEYLLHYATESPEVVNFYSGKIALDHQGEAVVELPDYFASINKDPRYLLTPVGAPMPMLHVAEEIDPAALAEGEAAGPGVEPPSCWFRVAGGVPFGTVCWRVEALRNDLRVRVHGAPVEREKLGLERGTLQHPEYHGLGPEHGLDHRLTTLARPR